MTLDLAALAAEFPREAISWRAQNVTRAGTKAMALAYIDARDVMDRLDAVVGAANWQDRYEVHGPKTICYLSLRIDGEWITKADGAGDSDVEAEKGAISDALKRAAVRWGIGRYLYALPAPWVPCESYQKNDKFYWTKWLGNPWDYVKAVPHTLVKDQRVIDGASVNSDDLVSEEQRDKLLSLIDEVGADVPKFCAYFRIDAIAGLPASRFAEAVRLLEQRRRK